MAAAEPEPPDFVRVKILARNEDIREHYTVGADIGEGSFSRVVEVTDIDDPTRRLAMKIQPKIPQTFLVDPELELLRLFKEILILKKILPKHPNIIEIKDVMIGPDEVFIVQEFCEVDNLDAFYHSADDAGARRVFGQLVDAVHTCHKHGVVHCDIKENNVFFLDRQYMQLKLADFGCSIYRPDMAVRRYNEFDHAKWFRPEELEPAGHATKFDDIKSLGRTLHAILCGKFVPFLFSNTVEEMQTRYRPRTERFDPGALHLLAKIGPFPFGPEEEQLWTTDQIRQHPWLTGEQGMPFPPAINLYEQFALLENDLTVLKGLLKDWMVMPMKILADFEDLPYENVGKFEKENHHFSVLVVALIKNLAMRRVAKVIHGKITDKADFVNEGYETRPPMTIYIEILITLRILPRHSHIVSIKDIYVNPEYVVVVKELLHSNTIKDFFPIANDLSSRRIFKQIADTVRDLHRHGVVHMDLQPDHIVFTDATFNHCKIIDFRRAFYVQQIAQLRHENFEPERYVTPELLAQMASQADIQVDISAFGRILHAMMTKTWEPDTTLCGDFWPLLEDFDPGASDLLSRIGPEPHGPSQQHRNITIDAICYHPWVLLPHSA